MTVPFAVSGANFAIAETGSIAVFESEGNGRMCLTMPRVLVTLMGIEKVLPRWEDMAAFLQLLPRSSTAERMNPYTSVWSGTKAGEGPQEFHLVLLDNGRTDVLADEAARDTLNCIRCSACLNICPVYERTGRAGVWVDLPRADRRHPDAAAHALARGRHVAVRLLALRGVLRRLPRQDRHPPHPRPPALQGRRGGKA